MGCWRSRGEDEAVIKRYEAKKSYAKGGKAGMVASVAGLVVWLVDPIVPKEIKPEVTAFVLFAVPGVITAISNWIKHRGKG